MAVDMRRPTQLLVLKRRNPLCLHYEASLMALFFSSRYVFLRKAFGHSVRTEALPSRCTYLFESERLLELGKRPTSLLPL